MKVLITGAGGFIGKSLRECLKKKEDLCILSPTRNELDISDENAVDKYIVKHKPDIIVHTANKGGDRTTISLEDVVHNNLRMFFNIAKQSSKVHKIIHLGSGAEYGKNKPIVDAKEEDANLAFPKDDYGFYKSVCSRYIEKSDNMVNLRIFGCYGEYEDYRFKFISNAIVKNLLHLPIVINQNVFFDYIYIEDLVRIIEWFIHNDSKYKIYNATSGKKIDLITLANTINKVSDFQSKIEVFNSGLNNEYTSSNQRLMEELGEFKFISHEKAIVKMRNYFGYNLDKLDQKTIVNDPYLKKCNTIWNKGN